MAIGARKRTALATVALTIAFSGAPPSEFRIFAAGENTTQKGTYLFDDQAARDVMAAFEAHGADLMIDLEHLSIEDPETSANFDPDARGWCRLEVRGGELWAAGVTWTPDGHTRLSEKRQRYISPVFSVDAAGRVVRVLNIAITAMPATDNLEPLVAARMTARDFRKLSTGIAFDDVRRALDEALVERYPRDPAAGPCCDAPWIQDIFDATVVYQYDGKLFELTYTFNGSVAALGTTPVEVKRTYAPVAAAPVAASRRTKLSMGEGDSPMTPEQLAQLAATLGLGTDAKVEDIIATVAGMVKTITDAANGAAPPPADAPADVPPPADAPPAVAASSRLRTGLRALVKLSGKGEIGELVREVEAWRKSHVDAESNRVKLAQDRETLEAGERRRLVADMVVLGSETPATAWADDTATKPAEPWASMALEQLRGRVAKLTAAKGGTLPPRGHVPPPSGGGEGGQAVTVRGEVVQLSAREVAKCAEKGTKLEEYASNKLIHERARASNQAS